MVRRRPSDAGGAGNRNVPLWDGAAGMKLRPGLSYERALSDIVARIGLRAACRTAGVAARTVQDWCDPDSPRSCPIHVAERLDHAWQQDGGTGRPLADTLLRRLDLLVPDAADSGVTIAGRFAEILVEGGEAKAAIFAVIDAGASPHHRARAAREVQDAIAAYEATLPLLIEPAMSRAPPA